jgi:hypothetical protein
MNKMAEISSSAVSQRVLTLLNAKPAPSSQWIYLAVILSLVAHIFALVVMYLATASPAGAEAKAEKTVDEIELKFEDESPMDEQDVRAANTSEVVRNLLANAQSQRTSDRVNFSAKSQEQINAEVEQSLKGLEQNEFNQLRSTHSNIPDNVPPPANSNAKDAASQSKDQYDWYKNASNKSYAGPVSAEFNLKDRSAKSSPRPTYRCKSSGQIVVKIAVAPTGEVIDAELDEGKSRGGDCIRDESLSYARKWLFNYNAASPKKQSGTITFTFSAQ